MTELSVYDNDPTLYLFTSLTAGSSHIVTATSRIETILRANKIPFKGVDTATDDLARKLYSRRASGKKLPLLVKEGYVIADLEQVEEWNEYDELIEALDVSAAPAFLPAKPAQAPSSSSTPAKAPTISAAANTKTKENTPGATPTSSSEQNLAIRQLGAEAAKVAASKKPVPANITITNPLLAEKMNSPVPGFASTRDAEKTDPSGLLSPRLVPLPITPNLPLKSPLLGASSPGVPKVESKPVHSPSSAHADAAAPRASTTVKSPTSSSSIKSPPLPTSPDASKPGVTSLVTESQAQKSGTSVKEENKKVEDEQAAREANSSEEEESEEE